MTKYGTWQGIPRDEIPWYPIVSVRKRAGYILEQLNCRNSYLKKIQKTIGSEKTYSLLGPSKPSRKGKLNKDWRIIVNE